MDYGASRSRSVSRISSFRPSGVDVMNSTLEWH